VALWLELKRTQIIMAESYEDYIAIECGDDCAKTHTIEVRGSVDAALKLLDEVLPGWDWALEKNEDGNYEACVSPDLAELEGIQVACASTPAAAIMAAVLRGVDHG